MLNKGVTVHMAKKNNPKLKSTLFRMTKVATVKCPSVQPENNLSVGRMKTFVSLQIQQLQNENVSLYDGGT